MRIGASIRQRIPDPERCKRPAAQNSFGSPSTSREAAPNRGASWPIFMGLIQCYARWTIWESGWQPPKILPGGRASLCATVPLGKSPAVPSKISCALRGLSRYSLPFEDHAEAGSDHGRGIASKSKPNPSHHVPGPIIGGDWHLSRSPACRDGVLGQGRPNRLFPAIDTQPAVDHLGSAPKSLRGLVYGRRFPHCKYCIDAEIIHSGPRDCWAGGTTTGPPIWAMLGD